MYNDFSFLLKLALNSYDIVIKSSYEQQIRN